MKARAVVAAIFGIFGAFITLAALSWQILLLYWPQDVRNYFVACARDGRAGAVRVLLSAGVRGECENDSGETALHAAVRRGDREMAELLIANGADVDAKAVLGDPPLFLTYDVQMIMALIARGANIHQRGAYGITLLHHIPARASQDEQVRLVEFLISKGMDVDGRDRDGKTPLHHAASLAMITGKTQVMEALIAHGADLNARDGGGFPTLHLLAWGGERESAERCIRLLIRRGANIESRDDRFGGTPLHSAVRYEKIQVVEILLACGADVNARNSKGCTPLHEAIDGGWNVEERALIVETLIAAGANVNAKNSYGSTPLHFALSPQERVILMKLLEAGADVNAVDSRGETPLHNCARSRYEEKEEETVKTVKLLVRWGANVNAVARNGWTPLHIAVYERHGKIAAALAACGARTDIRDIEGKTPMHIAEEKRDFGTLEPLFELRGGPISGER